MARLYMPSVAISLVCAGCKAHSVHSVDDSTQGGCILFQTHRGGVRGREQLFYLGGRWMQFAMAADCPAAWPHLMDSDVLWLIRLSQLIMV